MAQSVNDVAEGLRQADGDHIDRERRRQAMAEKAWKTKEAIHLLLETDASRVEEAGTRLHALALAWIEYPGVATYEQAPLPLCNEAEKVGAALWQAALGGADAQHLEREWSNALAVATARGGQPQHLLRFFQSMDNVFTEGILATWPYWMLTPGETPSAATPRADNAPDSPPNPSPVTATPSRHDPDAIDIRMLRKVWTGHPDSWIGRTTLAMGLKGQGVSRVAHKIAWAARNKDKGGGGLLETRSDASNRSRRQYRLRP